VRLEPFDPVSVAEKRKASDGEDRRQALIARPRSKGRRLRRRGQAAPLVITSSGRPVPTPFSARIEPSTPYPIDALGDVLKPAARAIAAKVQCADADGGTERSCCCESRRASAR
jgi:hypothetical protein